MIQITDEHLRELVHMRHVWYMELHGEIDDLPDGMDNDSYHKRAEQILPNCREKLYFDSFLSVLCEETDMCESELIEAMRLVCCDGE